MNDNISLLSIVSKGRKGTKKSYPVNLQGKIPGTNISGKQGIDTWEQTARKGRKGDSTLREVGGQVSHVNKKEATLIDALGPLGEAWVESIGSGTTNPKTGLKEYYDTIDWMPDWLENDLFTADSHKDMFHNIIETGTKSNNDIVSGVSKAADWLVGEDSWINSVGVNNTWRPASGDWGIFGSTWKSRQAKKKAEAAKRRRNAYRSFQKEHRDVDFAKMYQDGDGLDSIWQQELANNTFGLSKDDFTSYVSPYDSRAEDEVRDSTERAIDAAGRKTDQGLFGMLTQSSLVDTANDQIDTGDFHQKLAEENILKSGQTMVENTLDKAESTIQDSRDDWNNKFWQRLGEYNSAKNA